ncbi:hypothetical protein [Tateyamaria pelophila]|uniref:hypothetical protein n=1 Tax=Tateyamaria pelophila TaxID=328415 RepID=UPI001CBE6483|nr:hypothetical protein [Tateyamaria pelophila]
MVQINIRTKFEPGIGGRCVVDPAQLSELDRAELSRQLYAVNQRIFAGVSAKEFHRHVVDASADSTLIQLYFAADGQIKGYCAAHRFRRQVLGRNVIVLRAEAGLLPEYRGHSATYRFRMIRAVAEKLRHPFTSIYYVGTLVHTSSYAMACKNFSRVYPHPDHETPTVIQEVARELINSFSAPPVTETDPFVRNVGWVTIEAPHEKAPSRLDDQRFVQFFKERNPDYAKGHGLVVVVPITVGNIAVALLSRLHEFALMTLGGR